MEFHNYFTVRAGSLGGREVTAFNTAFSVMPYIKANAPYANFIALGSGGVAAGKLASIKFIAPTVLEDINPDVAKGILRAEYGVMVENVLPFSFTEFTLCANSDGSGVVSHAVCPSVQFDGEEMSVSSSIFVTIEGQDVHLVGGDNALARLLLGQKAVSGTCKICTGDCYYPNLDVYRGKSAYVTENIVTPVWGDDGITFSANVSGDKAEILVTLDDVPILRSFPDYTTEINTYVTRGSVSGGFAVAGRFPKDVFNLSQNGAQITNYYLWRRSKSLYDVVSPINFLLGQVSDIKNDPQQEYIAVTTQKEVILLKFSDVGVKLVLRAPYNGEYVEACVGGRLALWSDSKFIVYSPDAGGKYSASEYAVGKGSQNAVVYEPGAFHAGRILNGYIERFKISPTGGVEQIYTLPAGARQVLARDFSYIAWYGYDCPIGVATINGHSSVIEGNISRLNTASGAPTKLITGEGIMYLDSPKMKNVFITYNSAKLVRFPYEEQFLISNNTVLRYMNTEVREVRMIDNGALTIAPAGNLPKIAGKEVKGLANASGWMVILYDDGTLTARYMSGDVGIVASPDVAANVDVSYSSREKNVPYMNNTNTVTIKLEYATA